MKYEGGDHGGGGGFGEGLILLPGAHANPVVDRAFVNGLQAYSPNFSECVDRTEDCSVLVLPWVCKMLGVMRIPFGLEFQRGDQGCWAL